MDDADPVPYVIRVPELGVWWRPRSSGYTHDLLAAGVYSKDVAEQICAGLHGSSVVMRRTLNDINSDAMVAAIPNLIEIIRDRYDDV